MLSETPDAPPAIARRDIFVLGLRRSGIHAIVSWLIPHLEGLTRVVNDPWFEVGAAPPLEGRPIGYYYSKGGRAVEAAPAQEFRSLVNGVALDDAQAYLRSLNPLARLVARPVLKGLKRYQRSNPVRPALFPYAVEAEGGLVDHNLFVIENMTPAEFLAVYPRWRETDYLPWLARHGRVAAPERIFLPVLREPWNQLASILSNPPRRPPRVLGAEDYAGKWIDFADEFIGEGSRLAGLGKVVPVLFPRWFSDKAYRVAVADRLGVPPTDAGLHVVANFGGGSSFEGQSKSGQAQTMKVGERWKVFADHPLMRGMQSDAAIRSRGRTLFGREWPDSAA
jgi:hypothetical protein